MKNNILKTIIKILFIIAIIITIGIIVILITIPKRPKVKQEEKKDVINYVENYLNKNYGEHEFKVNTVDYDIYTKWESWLDFSDIRGYNVYCKSDIVKEFYIHISGLTPSEYKITTDSFLKNYYFPNRDDYDQMEEMDSLIQTGFIDSFKNGFEPNSIFDEQISIEKLIIPDNLGKIITKEELKNDIKYYQVEKFEYKVTYTIENGEEYKEKLTEYLKQNLGGDWNVWISRNMDDITTVHVEKI